MNQNYMYIHRIQKYLLHLRKKDNLAANWSNVRRDTCHENMVLNMRSTVNTLLHKYFPYRTYESITRLLDIDYY